MEAIGRRETTTVDRTSEAADVPTTVLSPAEEVTLLPGPRICTGDMGSDLAILMVQAAHEDERVSDMMRASEERLQEAAEAAELSAMSDKSNANFAAGLAGGFASVGAGAVSFGGLGSGDNNAFAHSAKILDGAGKLGSACGSAAAGEADDQATKQGQLASRHGRAASDAKDHVKNAEAHVDRVMDLYKEYSRTRTETQRAALLRA